MVVKDFKI